MTDGRKNLVKNVQEPTVKNGQLLEIMTNCFCENKMNF